MTGVQVHPPAEGPADPPSPAPRLVLASQSPRRRRLLAWLGLPFSATSVDTPEELDSPLAGDPSALAESLAAEKALATRAAGRAEGALVLCFDTIVVLGDEVLGKPRDLPDAWRMLRALSGRTHQVVTGVALACPGDQTPRTFSVTTDVTMKRLSDRRIEAWMAQGEFMGCAGAYNIEGQVAEVTTDECYQNVAGIPLCHLCAVLEREADRGPGGCLDASRPTSPVATCDAALGRACRLGPHLVSGAD